MRKSVANSSTAQAAQRKHWETTGQLTRMIKLCEYILDQPYVPQKTRFRISQAVNHLNVAREMEAENNQFINLKLPRGF